LFNTMINMNATPMTRPTIDAITRTQNVLRLRAATRSSRVAIGKKVTREV